MSLGYCLFTDGARLFSLSSIWRPAVPGEGKCSTTPRCSQHGEVDRQTQELRQIILQYLAWPFLSACVFGVASVRALRDIALALVHWVSIWCQLVRTEGLHSVDCFYDVYNGTGCRV